MVKRGDPSHRANLSYWRRHAHASHATDGDASLPVTLGHGNVATTNGYLHARAQAARAAYGVMETCCYDADEKN
jgi:hypothetical protein